MALGLYWDEVPRCFGNPEQTMIYDKKVLNHLVNKNNGIRPCFITHNSFRLSDFGFPSEVKVSKIFAGDLDNERKPENALLDCRKLCRFGIEMNIPLSFSFSAGKGFHCYCLVEPKYYEVGFNLKQAIRAVQLFFRGLGEEDESNQEYKNSLRTHDPKILGDERRLCRVWMSKYVSGQKKKKLGDFLRLPYKCCPLTNDMVLNWSFKKIQEYSLDPDHIKFDWSDFKSLNLAEFIKKFNIRKPTSYMGKPYSASDGSIVEYKGVADDFILRLFPDRPCIAEGICSENPDHLIRFAATSYLKNKLNMNEKQIFNLFWSRNWIDRDNIDKCKYQIHQIFMANGGRGYRTPNCEWLRMNNFCIGFDKCEEIRSDLIPDYKKFNIEEWT